MKRYFCLMLHGHIPYVKKAGVWPFGEEWLLEGILETYIPLLEMLDGFHNVLHKDNKIRITLGLTPVLVEQLKDDYFKSRFVEYATDRIQRAKSDKERFAKAHQIQLESLADFYMKLFEHRLNYYEGISGDIVGKFSELQKSGCVEIITSAATHAYLPLLKRDSSILAQIKIGVETYKKYFGVEPSGFWLPECAYRGGYSVSYPADGKVYYKRSIDEFLAEFGLKYFVVDSHTLEGGETFPYFNGQIDLAKNNTIPVTSFKTTLCAYKLKSGVVVLGRNRKTGMLVWSADIGYPGDGDYREFHKKDSVSGLNYWRVTSKSVDLGQKELYIPENAKARIEENSEHFKDILCEIFNTSKVLDTAAVGVIAPYDAELYGHWWFEGVEWLKKTLKKVSNSGILVDTVSKYLSSATPKLIEEIPESSWGDGGGHYIWLNKDTMWMWDIIGECEKQIEKLVDDYDIRTDKDDFKKAILNQIAREKLLLEASDWPFLVTTRQAKEYSESRFLAHYNRFVTLTDMFYKEKLSREEVQKFEQISAVDSLFADINFKDFVKREP